jgi:hypothetical protein
MVLISALTTKSSPLSGRLTQAGIAAGAAPDAGMVISGAPQSGKSSLAFQAAVTAACAGHAVAFLCAEDVLQSKMPRPQVALEDLPGDVLSRIEFQYAASLRDVRQFAAVGLHEAGLGGDEGPSQPAVIVVDDDSLAEAHDRLEVAKTLAALEDAVMWLRANANTRGSHDECGPHTAFFVYVTNQPVPGAWQDGPPATGPFAHVDLHLVTRRDGAGAPGDCMALLWTARPTAPVQGPVAALHYTIPADGALAIR